MVLMRPAQDRRDTMTNLIAIAKKTGTSVLPDNDTHENRLEIKSASSNRVYVIAQSKSSGEWQCSCPGWVLKKAGKERSCKHLESMMLSLLQISNGKARALPKIAEEPTKKSRQASNVVLNNDTVMKLRKCLEDMDNRNVVRYKLPTCVNELIKTLEESIK